MTPLIFIIKRRIEKIKNLIYDYQNLKAYKNKKYGADK